MYIWKLDREAHVDYDENAGFVIAADTEVEARMIAADAYAEESRETWLFYANVTAVGTAFEDLRAGIILTDFNAG